MQEYIDSILHGICAKLQLTESLYDKANERYQVIAKTLHQDDAFFGMELNIYPQGSFRLGTTVKPIYQNEYDLDFVAELPDTAVLQPECLYNLIYKILKNDGVHNEMVERKNRCIRVNYKNDFHLDIMPAKLFNSASKEIIVPDRELTEWYHHSNPIRYAEWFESRARTAISRALLENRKLTASIAPISQQEITERLQPLKKAVQLIKRYRDIYCDSNKKEPVRSIIICTLMGGISSTYSDTLQIIKDFCEYVNLLSVQSERKPFEIKNPVVEEVLSEKWLENYQNFYDFLEMVEALRQDINNLSTYSINKDMNTLMKKMFGERVTNEAIIKNAERIETARQTNNLFINSSGTLKTDNVGISVKKNTFYGKEDIFS